MKTVTVSAPGKVILAGEHAVVYGYSAIVAAIDKRMKVTVKESKKVQEYSGLVRFALELMGEDKRGWDIKIDSQIPIGSGLGSSAALATALVWAIKPAAKIEEKDKLIKEIEDFAHGKSSGVDQTIVREGGFLRFRQGKFKKITLPISRAILIDSGRPAETTGEMVGLVARGNRERQMKQIGEIVNKWTVDKISLNEKLLEQIGVVGGKAKSMIRAVEAMGGQAKICGAGGVRTGSGMILAYAQNEDKLRQLIKDKNWPHMEVKFGGKGARYEG